MPQYKQFTREEELDLFERWRSQGDREAYRLLVESQMAWARKIAHDYCRLKNWPDEEEAECAAYEGLVEGVSRFNPGMGTRLSTYAYWYCLKNVRIAYRTRLLIHVPPNSRLLQDAARALRVRSMRPVNMEGDEYDDLPSVCDDVIGHVDAKELREHVDDALGDLESRTAEIIRRHVMQGETLVKVGASLGISKERVRQIKKRALPLLHKRLSRNRIRT